MGHSTSTNNTTHLQSRLGKPPKRIAEDQYDLDYYSEIIMDELSEISIISSALL
jgi:hypothetical protein